MYVLVPIILVELTQTVNLFATLSKPVADSIRAGVSAET